MNSPLPKVVHPVAGRPMIERVIQAVKTAGAKEVRVVVGFGENVVRPILDGEVVILNGDHPLMEASDIERFRREFKESKASIAVVTCELEEPGSFGRIVRHQGRLRAIVEAKDASHETRKIREINTGIYIAKAEVLNSLLPEIESHNAQGEFYLTDLISLAVEGELPVEGLPADPRVALGVNTQAELANATRLAFKRKAERLMESGVMMIDPSSVFIEDGVSVEPGTMVYPNVFMRGKTKIGGFSVVEAGCVIIDSESADHVHLKAGCYIEGTKIGANVDMGPYAHMRPGTEIGENCHIGNFVEMKKAKFGKGAKAGHLTYLGDAEIGENTNIGCGTITCNYAADRKKYVTKIGKDVFVGSDTQFVAPVTIGDGSYIGSGSTITKDVPAKALAVSRGRQHIVENYQPRAPLSGEKSGKKEK